MNKSKAYAVSGMLFGLIGIDLVVQHDLLAASAMFVLAIGSGLKAHGSWLRDHA